MSIGSGHPQNTALKPWGRDSNSVGQTTSHGIRGKACLLHIKIFYDHRQCVTALVTLLFWPFMNRTYTEVLNLEKILYSCFLSRARPSYVLGAGNRKEADPTIHSTLLLSLFIFLNCKWFGSFDRIGKLKFFPCCFYEWPNLTWGAALLGGCISLTFRMIRKSAIRVLGV